MVTRIAHFPDFAALNAALNECGAVLLGLACGQELHADDFVVKGCRTHRTTIWYPLVQTEEIADFVALVAAEDRDFRGRRRFHILGFDRDGIPLPHVVVPAARFGSLAWVVEDWGTRAVIAAGKRPRMAEAILKLSNAVPEPVAP
jgi:hypothetical protein